MFWGNPNPEPQGGAKRNDTREKGGNIYLSVYMLRSGYNKRGTAQRGCNSVNKKAIKEYCMLRRELDQISARIERISKELEAMESGATVSDVVTRGRRGGRTMGVIKVTGFPDKRYQELKRQRINAKIANEELAERITMQMYEVEQYICSIDDSETRQILRTLCTSTRCLTWQQLANELNRHGGMYTGEAVRKKVERFLNS